MGDADRWEGRYARERAARLQAEQIAERAIADLYEANQELDQRVAQRTEELAAALARAETADRAKSTFLHGLAHELATPLHAIAGLLELVRERSDDPEVRSTILRVEQSTTRLHQALRALVELSALTVGQLEVDTVDVQLGAYADRLSQRWTRRAAERGMLLTVEVWPDPATTVRADQTRIDQIADALIGNAVRYGAGRVSVALEVRTDPRPELVLRVADEGPGIPEDLRPLVFEPFQRAVDTDGGFGIGLTLAQWVASGLGGTLVLLPAGEETTFEAVLPVEPG